MEKGKLGSLSWVAWWFWHQGNFTAWLERAANLTSDIRRKPIDPAVRDGSWPDLCRVSQRLDKLLALRWVYRWWPQLCCLSSKSTKDQRFLGSSLLRIQDQPWAAVRWDFLLLQAVLAHTLWDRICHLLFERCLPARKGENLRLAKERHQQGQAQVRANLLWIQHVQLLWKALVLVPREVSNNPIELWFSQPHVLRSQGLFCDAWQRQWIRILLDANCKATSQVKSWCALGQSTFQRLWEVKGSHHRLWTRVCKVHPDD